MTKVAATLLLVVEDHPETREFLEMALSDEFDVEFAVSAEEALEKVGDGDYDLLLVDIALPGEMNGVELVQCLRETPAHGELPMIAMTAHQLLEDRQYFLERGFDDYLAKPFYPSDLIEAIHKLVGDGGNGPTFEERPR